MKHFIHGIKTYAIVMVLISSMLTIVGALLLFLFGSHKGITISDVVDFAWARFYITGSLIGGNVYKFHIVGLLLSGLLNYIDSVR